MNEMTGWSDRRHLSLTGSGYCLITVTNGGPCSSPDLYVSLFTHLHLTLFLFFASGKKAFHGKLCISLLINAVASFYMFNILCFDDSCFCSLLSIGTWILRIASCIVVINICFK